MKHKYKTPKDNMIYGFSYSSLYDINMIYAKHKDDIQTITDIMSNDTKNITGYVSFVHIVKALKSVNISKKMMDYLRERTMYINYDYLDKIAKKYNHTYG